MIVEPWTEITTNWIDGLAGKITVFMVESI